MRYYCKMTCEDNFKANNMNSVSSRNCDKRYEKCKRYYYLASRFTFKLITGQLFCWIYMSTLNSNNINSSMVCMLTSHILCAVYSLKVWLSSALVSCFVCLIMSNMHWSVTVSFNCALTQHWNGCQHQTWINCTYNKIYIHHDNVLIICMQTLIILYC